jgi:16S rRNA (guanine527-N7)-methyltransferase
VSGAEARLAELADEYDLDPGARERLAALLAALAADLATSTPIRHPGEAVDVHVADSLSGLHVPALRTARDIADLGAGAGFPGLVLAAVRPDAQVTLVESARRKAAAIERLAATAGIPNAAAVAARAEAWPAGLEAHDAVTARALAALPVLVEYAAPLLRPDGVLVAWKGDPEATEIADGEAAAAALGLRPEPPVPVQPFPDSRRRHLYLYSKVKPTPQGFPRRPGMAVKRPLRANTQA